MCDLLRDILVKYKKNKTQIGTKELWSLSIKDLYWVLEKPLNTQPDNKKVSTAIDLVDT